MAVRASIACVLLLNLPSVVQSATCPTNYQVKANRCASPLQSDCTDAGCCEYIPTTTCTSYSCASGYKHVTAANTIYCAASGCASVNCCEADTTKCGGLLPINCAVANSYYDTTKAGAAATAATKNDGTTCCTAKSACTASACLTGYKLRANPSSIYCASSTCATGDNTVCCEADDTKCGGLLPIVCAVANSYIDTAKAGASATAATKNDGTTCCTAKSACTASACSAGYKLRANPSSIYCASSTCATTDNTVCCEPDTTKCGGTTVATCTYGNTHYYWDSAKAGTVFTTKATDCCTEKTVCATAYPSSSGGSSGGTTGSTSGAFKKELEATLFCIITTLLVGVAQWR